MPKKLFNENVSLQTNTTGAQNKKKKRGKKKGEKSFFIMKCIVTIS